ncbi:hypothetical protein GCM10027190_53740 [Spirosoma areae]
MLLALYRPLYAQTPSRPDQPVCGTQDLTPAQAEDLRKQIVLALKRKMAARRAFTDITYVPIRPHIIRRSDGTGGFELSSLNEVMAATNRYFLLNGSGIQYYFAGIIPNYIDNDGLYENFSENSPINGYNVTNALNQYYVHTIVEGFSGLADFPADNPNSTRSIIVVDNANHVKQFLGSYTIPHELGHTWGLLHTWGYGIGTMLTDELVTRGAGANCNSAGDFVCDTPADPYNVPGINFINQGCPQYDPTSTPRDANGEPFNPSTTNIMSYYVYPGCPSDFTPGQYDRIQQGLALRQSHTTYTLDAPATNVTPPTNLANSLNGLSVVLTWQDNANNEMGYFIERSTSPNEGYVAVGGVAPNVTTFTDTRVALGSQYYYRIRPSNTTTGNLSLVLPVYVCPTPSSPNSTSISRTSASLSWSGFSGQTYSLRWRVVGTTPVNVVNNITSTSYSLTGLSSQTAYEWQVQGVCSPTVSSTFTNPQTFTTLACQVPQFAGTSNVGGASAQFYWYATFNDPDRTTELRYRVVGTPGWITIGNLMGSSSNSTYTLTGLTNNTTYEWQLRSRCTATEFSDYTPVATFTINCRMPAGLTDTPTATGATLGWSISSAPDPGTAYEVQYRPVGSTAWNTVGNSSSRSYTLAGLTNNTPYEWRVRTACSASSYSDYSTLKSFTTVCRTVATNAFFPQLATPTSIQLRWNVINDVGTQYDIRYRPVGSANWLTVSTTSSTTSTVAYTLSGLTSNTTYEWQVRTVCSPTQSSTYTPGPNFTTLAVCPVPINLYPTPLVTSVFIIWSQMGADVTYDVQYRVAGTTDWTTTISSLTTNSVTITGLNTNFGYDYQVRTRCSDGSYSGFSSVRTFFTLPCTLPFSLLTTNLTVASAQVNWSFYNASPGTRQQVRYRVVGTANWSVVNDLVSTNGAGSAVLTGLSSGTMYEWQIRTLCSGTESSDFSTSVTFQTPATCPTMFTVKAGSWNDPTVWSCGRLPVSSDVVQVKHLVTIPPGYLAMAKRVGFDAGQTLSYGASAQLKVGF